MASRPLPTHCRRANPDTAARADRGVYWNGSLVRCSVTREEMRDISIHLTCVKRRLFVVELAGPEEGATGRCCQELGNPTYNDIPTTTSDQTVSGR